MGFYFWQAHYSASISTILWHVEKFIATVDEWMPAAAAEQTHMFEVSEAKRKLLTSAQNSDMSYFIFSTRLSARAHMPISYATRLYVYSGAHSYIRIIQIGRTCGF